MKNINLHSALKKHFGFDKFKGNQEKIIKSIIKGDDVFVIMPTGGGKSLCYQLPALISEGVAIIVSPLIALMKNQVDAMRGYSSNNGIVHYLNSTLNKTKIKVVKKDLIEKTTKILYVAPETLIKEENVDLLKSLKVSFAAVDEAHCISEWGHDFRPEYRRIKEIIKYIHKDTPIVALTATATPKVQLDIIKNLDMKNAVVYKSSFNRPNLFYEVRAKIKPDKQIIKFIKNRNSKSGIIYCLSRKNVEKIAEQLQINGIKALPYHAGLEPTKRTKHQDMFLMEECDVIVATIAFGMGIDKPDVRFVIHYDMPKSLEGYYQETGRAGRDGGEGHCIAFYDYKDIEKLENFLVGKPLSEQEIGKQLLQEVVAYAETSISRRKFLLHYFGEEWDENQDDSKMDDNLLNPKEQKEGKKEVLLLLETIQGLHQQFKGKHIVNVLIGKETGEVKSNRHNKSEYFNQGADYDALFWNSVIRQSLISGLLKKDVDSYGNLLLTKEGLAFIKKPKPFILIKEHDFSKEMEESNINDMAKYGVGVGDEVLLKILKSTRRKLAKEKNIPPYVVFQDPSLEDMVNQYPISMEELQNITGVGKGKAQKYGEPFLKVIKEYVEENEIDRPQDFTVKTVANRSSNKIAIIQAIDRKVSLFDIAKTKGISNGEFLKELENIVYSGTKLNINYYIKDIIDEDLQKEIFDCFLKSNLDSLDEVRKEFDEDEISEEELRLMRIKFISDYGN